MNTIKQFTFFRNYYELIKELSEKDKKEFSMAIMEFVFEDKEPNFKGLKKSIWNLIERPLIISKNKANSAKKKIDEENQIQIKCKSNQNQIKIKSKTNQKHSPYSISSSISTSILKKDKQENRVIGEEDEQEKTFRQIVEHLNRRAGTSYRYTSKTTKDKIKARLNEGYTLDDFIVVIDNKVAEWHATDMQKYLRPETLFGPKFEGYLNQKNTKTDKLPSWFDKKQTEDKITKEEKEELDKVLEDLGYETN